MKGRPASGGRYPPSPGAGPETDAVKNKEGDGLPPPVSATRRTDSPRLACFSARLRSATPERVQEELEMSAPVSIIEGNKYDET